MLLTAQHIVRGKRAVKHFLCCKAHKRCYLGSMSIEENLHPLRAWLDQKGLSPYDFAPMSGISVRQIYQILDGAEPRLETMRKIESASDGAVTMRAIADWMETLKLEKRA